MPLLSSLERKERGIDISIMEIETSTTHPPCVPKSFFSQVFRTMQFESHHMRLSLNRFSNLFASQFGFMYGQFVEAKSWGLLFLFR